MGLDRVDGEGDDAGKNGTLISDARDIAYALGNSDKSLDCQYTDTGSAQTVPVENTVSDRTIVELDTSLDDVPDTMLYAKGSWVVWSHNVVLDVNPLFMVMVTVTGAMTVKEVERTLWHRRKSVARNMPLVGVSSAL